MNSSVMNEKNVKPLGRTQFVDDMLWLAYSGSGAEFTFNGSSCTVTMMGDDNILSEDFDSLPRIAIYLDGERVVEKVLDKQEESFSVLEGDAVGEHTVRVVKLSETGNSTCAIKCVETNSYGRIKATEPKEHSIEFIGDSITCGYGVDSEIGKPFSTRTEDCTKAYAYKTAELLGADYSLVSKSGHGIISGYTGDGTKQTWGVMPDYYESFGSGAGAFAGKSPDSIKWDFKSREQDVVVINLGTNDFSYTGRDEARCEEYKLGYIQFIKRVRELNPKAKIICALGIMGDELYPTVEAVVEEYVAATEDENIAAFHFQPQNPDDGYGADWHPSAATHDKAASALADFIKDIMNW